MQRGQQHRVSLVAEIAAAPARLQEVEAARSPALLKRWAMARRIPARVPSSKKAVASGSASAAAGSAAPGSASGSAAGSAGPIRSVRSAKSTSSSVCTDDVADTIVLLETKVELLNEDGEWQDVRRFGVVTVGDKFDASAVSEVFAASFGVKPIGDQVTQARGGADRAMLAFRFNGKEEVTVKGSIGDCVGDIFLGHDVVRALRARGRLVDVKGYGSGVDPTPDSP